MNKEKEEEELIQQNNENNYENIFINKNNDINSNQNKFEKNNISENNKDKNIDNKKESNQINNINIKDDINNYNKNNNKNSFNNENNIGKIILSENNNDKNAKIRISDELIILDSDLKKTENLTNKNIKIFFYTFGQYFEEKYTLFMESLGNLIDISYNLKTTFYTLSYGQIKNIIDKLIQANEIIIPYISSEFYLLIVNNAEKFKIFKNIEDIFEENNELSKIMIEIQIEIIKFITIQNIFIKKMFNKDNIKYSSIKFFQDIGFCIKFFSYAICELLFSDDFIGYEYHHDIRILYYLELSHRLSPQSNFPQDLLKLATESVKIKDAIILGEKQFREHIISLNIQLQRIHELDDNMFDSFFKKPYMVNNKYKITKYFIICEEKNEKIYLEKFKKLSSKYGFEYLFLIYIKNRQIFDMRINLNKSNSVIYIYNDFELLEYFKDNNERLKPNLYRFLPEYNNYTLEKINDFVEKHVYKDIKDFKSNCEDGWELFEFKNEAGFIQISIISFHDFVNHVFGNLFQSYKEHNSLEILLKYYINYFSMALQPELIVNMTAYAKMFLYAYTLEEKDPHKNLYCILNDDLRSSNPARINRHFNLIKLIGGLININELKSYKGKVYRATYFKEDLIKKIKIGSTITNSAFWSSTKKESVALKFLKKNINYKNGLLIAEGGLNNNVDIHLEEISRYPKEEEVLFLPFCLFKIKSFEKVNENNLSYYKLVLEKDSDSSIIDPFNKSDIDSLNFEKNV